MNHRYLMGLLLLAGLGPLTSTAQSYRISGRITAAATGEGIPFAAISLQNKPIGTTADADGKYTLTTQQLADSLVVLSLGYRPQTVALTKAPSQTVDIQLTPAATSLKEVRVYAKGGDPAYRVLREAARRRAEFDPRQLSAFQYDNYTRVEGYINDFGRKARQRNRKPGPIGRLLGSLPSVTDDNGQPAVPVFISENSSNYYERHQPDYTKERILKTRIRAVGITDGSLISQFTGASFQQYNFYRAYVSMLQKDIPSPVGEVWQAIYTYRMVDTLAVGETVCYQIDFEPKRKTDLAFAGTVWLDTTRLGLVQLEARVGRQANINFVEALRIEQAYETVATGARLPNRTQVLIDTEQPTPNAPGALIRFFMAASNIVINQPQPAVFYDPAIELADDYRQEDLAYWEQTRPDPLTEAEARAFRVVDSVRNVPFVRFSGEVVKLAANGYQPIGHTNLDIGPMIYSYANNTIEGNRFRLGLRTNGGFSHRWVLSGYGAYGTRDGKFKYSIGAEYIASRKPWTVIGFQHSYDLERIGVSPETIPSTIFLAYARFGTQRRAYFQEQSYGYIRRDLGKGFSQSIGVRTRTFDPQFAFGYVQPGSNPTEGNVHTSFQTAELLWETRFAPDEIQLQNDNERLTVGSSRKPVFTFRYALSLRHVLNSDFTYQRLSLEIKQTFRLGVFGRTTYVLDGGIIPSTLPYPLLFVPIGNQSSFRLGNAYNLMNYFEFATDRYVSAKIEHNFDGYILNRIPAIRRLKWRTVISAKVLYGSVSAANQALTPATDQQGNALTGFRALGRVPYVEVGYGIDNIFKLIRVDAIHRLTYRNLPDVTPFAIKASAWVKL